MRRRRMGAIPVVDHSGLITMHGGNKHHGEVVEEIHGLIKVYRDGHVDRLPAMPEVPSTWSPEADVASTDEVIGASTGLWARVYVPRQRHGQQLPVVVYFHGGGFCVGSAAWSCYHEFSARLASRAGCVVVSVNYRLAPEHRLPAAYEDGHAAVKWLRQQASCGGYGEARWWQTHCNFSRVFLAGDSAGGAIAYNVAAQLGSNCLPESAALKPICLRGLILIQPFFGGESRTSSERSLVQSSRSALSLPTSDCYWRMALPAGANRDHRWCNPLSKGAAKPEELRLPPMLVCISEMDILRDQNLEFCKAMKMAGKIVEHATYDGVGHAFQVLHNSHMAQVRAHEMLTHIKSFIKSR